MTDSKKGKITTTPQPQPGGTEPSNREELKNRVRARLVYLDREGFMPAGPFLLVLLGLGLSLYLWERLRWLPRPF